jgi:hypothetical protein
VTARTVVVASASSYQILSTFPGPGHARVVNDAKLHVLDPGVMTAEIFSPDPTKEILIPVVFDPAIGAGVHETTPEWIQETGAGNALFAANEMAMVRLGIRWTSAPDGTVPPPPPPPPPTAIDCAGTWGVQELSAGKWIRVFTVTTQPANGGKSCAVVAAGG